MTEATVPSKATVHCALELSKSSWLLAIQYPDRPQPSLYRIKGGDVDSLISRWVEPFCRPRDESHPSCAISPCTQQSGKPERSCRI
jgi:hypothetical protein